jgi:tRNA-modifying protein YgfZ
LIQGYYKYNTEILKVTGEDKQDFFNRITTNYFTEFPYLNFKKTVFLTERGRIVDFCTVLNCNETYIVICTPGNGNKLKKHIERFTVTEDINVVQEPGKILYFIGNDYLFIDYDLENKNIAFFDDNLIFRDDYGFQKTVILESGISENAFLNKIKDKTELISETDFQIFSFHNFFLRNSYELSEDFNPLECYLNDFISFDKGCYIGQEVIARISSQGKISSYIVGIESNTEIRRGDKIFSKFEYQELECGMVTSVSEKSGYFYGFGFIRANFLQNSRDFCINRNKIFINNKIN